MLTFQRAVEGEWRGEIGFSPDGRWIASSSNSYSPYVGPLFVPFVLYDTTGQESPKEFPRVDAPFLFVRNGAAILFPLNRWKHSQLGALDIATGEVEEVSFGHGNIGGIAAGTSGDRFYLCVQTLEGMVAKSSAGPSEIRAYSEKTLKYLETLGVTPEEASGLEVSADSRWVATGIRKSSLLWNIGKATPSTKPKRKITPNDPSSCALSADGQLFVMAGQHAVRAWDTATGKQVFSSGQHKRAVWDVACCPTRPLIASGDSKGNVYFWDHTGKVLTRYSWELQNVRSLCFAPDGFRCAAADMTGKIVVWDVDV